MRLRHPSGSTVHLAYCTNVHPADDLAGVLDQLDRFAAPIRAELEVDVLGLGLWLAEPVAAALAEDASVRRRLRRELQVRGLEVVTLNGFPYGAFHAPVVKHAVYRPDWTDPRRLRYTVELVQILAEIMPDAAARGSVSTLPLGWRAPWRADQADAAARQLAQLGQRLAAEHGRTGRMIRVGFEPEPGCVVETTAQAVAALADVDHEYLGICFDLAHVACAWEAPEEAVSRYAAAGLPIVKTQVSAALEVPDPHRTPDLVAGYVEPRFLHQTRTASGAAFDDLPEALAAAPDGPWRVHFHVPLHAAPAPPLAATVPVVRAGLAALVGGDAVVCDHLEVETYTWTVLPPDLHPRDERGLVRGIAAELRFARAELASLGLFDVSSPVEVA
ncbi:MAG TPA: metabolite traffic protein EboE [Micromonosporaceae bacterium]